MAQLDAADRGALCGLVGASKVVGDTDEIAPSQAVREQQAFCLFGDAVGKSSAPCQARIAKF
jgi:hypothetical protein